MALDPNVWGPHYWFTLHTISLCYPLHPNDVTKKKYYEFIQNFPMFIPNEKIASDFSILLDEYPVTPYLDSRPSFIKWVHFIHNKINKKLEKPSLTLEEFYSLYYENYKPKHVVNVEWQQTKKKMVYCAIIAVILGGVYILYDK